MGVSRTTAERVKRRRFGNSITTVSRGGVFLASSLPLSLLFSLFLSRNPTPSKGLHTHTQLAVYHVTSYSQLDGGERIRLVLQYSAPLARDNPLYSYFSTDLSAPLRDDLNFSGNTIDHRYVQNTTTASRREPQRRKLSYISFTRSRLDGRIIEVYLGVQQYRTVTGIIRRRRPAPAIY